MSTDVSSAHWDNTDSDRNSFIAKIRQWGRYAVQTRHGGTLIFIGLFVLVATLLRAAFFFRSITSVTWDWTLPTGFVVGFIFDLVMALFFVVPMACFLAVAPARCFSKKWFRGIIHGIFIVALGLFLFGAVSEWVFWNEFYVRFNFIAVDYLVYTREVVKNIQESYNMPLIYAGLAVATLVAYGVFLATGLMKTWFNAAGTSRWRWKGLLCVLVPNAAAIVTALAIGMKEPGAQGKFLETLSQGLRHMTAFQPSFSNSFNTELAKNGEYALLAAFWSNELGYNEFYPKLPDNVAYARLRELLKQDNSTFISTDPHDISRQITGGAHPHRWNVIQITVESLSAAYLGCYQQPPYSLMGLTPNLDRISRESLWFKNFYAGGTRTVRGMEALVLSVPPTPGQSVLRRPNNENMFSLGGVFQSQNYDTAFIYGGSGFFDNMNYFFANNGFRIVDCPAKIQKDNPVINFENAWGVCDEDLLDWTITEADRAYANGKNFYHFVMTTSNHRPFTWPEGRIDIPSGKGLREGGVKYTDYAIGRFLKEAEKHPWFKDTIFVIVADHCASVAGKRELEVRKYEIPLFIYAPHLIKPHAVDTLCSQVDYAPTLLGLLDWTYQSRFMGRDVLRPSAESQRAFISNYQKIAVLEDKSLGVLKPVGVSEGFFCDRSTGAISLEDKHQEQRILNDAIAYYQCASEILAKGLQKDFDHLKAPAQSVGVAHNTHPSADNP